MITLFSKINVTDFYLLTYAFYFHGFVELPRVLVKLPATRTACRTKTIFSNTVFILCITRWVSSRTSNLRNIVIFILILTFELICKNITLIEVFWYLRTTYWHLNANIHIPIHCNIQLFHRYHMVSSCKYPNQDDQHWW